MVIECYKNKLLFLYKRINMKKINSVEDALRLFEENVVKRGVAFDADDFKTYNKFLPIIYKCIVYLHDNHQLKLLYKFLHHKNHHVRSTAAYALLPLYEKDCIMVLQEIENGNYGLQCLDAKTTLMMWNSGELKFPYQPEFGKKSSPKKEEKPYDKVSKEEMSVKSKEFSPSILRLSQIFGCPPANDTELRNEETGFYIMLDTKKQVMDIRINTFVNPYTQDVEGVYQERLERFKAFEPVATVSADKPSKLGYMQIVLTIPEKKATDDILLEIKDAIDWNYREWKPNESLVWFKVKYHKGISYFEGSWWYPHRAVIKNRRGYERYDFSDEMTFDEEMWDIVQGEYDEFEYSDSFALIDSEEFHTQWNITLNQG